MVFVCEQHDDALRWLHYLIRRKLCSFENLDFLHFDSHPDMSSVLNVKAEVCEGDPRELYSMLKNDDSGIASWILPAVYMGHVSRVIWVKQPFCRQMPVGSWDGFVGKCPNDGAVKTDVALSYFQDDGVMSMELENIQPWELKVVELPEEVRVTSRELLLDSPEDLELAPSSGASAVTLGGSSSTRECSAVSVFPRWAEIECESRVIGHRSSTTAASFEWVLDIDLDYFTTRNPFAKNIDSKLVDLIQKMVESIERRGTEFQYEYWAAKLDQINTVDEWDTSMIPWLRTYFLPDLEGRQLIKH